MRARFTVPAFRCGLLVVVSVVVTAVPAAAKILKTRPAPSADWTSAVVIGSGVEIESDSEQTQYDFPMLIEYHFSEFLQLTVEPDIVHIESKAPDVRTVSGLGDLETTLEYEFLHERRYRPALAAGGAIKFPTSTDPDLGSPKFDYTLGLIASKDLVFADLDLNLAYTFIGDCNVQDVIELSVAAEWPVTYFLDVLTEVTTTFGTGAVRGRSGTLTGLGGSGNAGSETEGLLGFAVHVNKFLKLEQGIVRKSDQSWQFVFAWEYAFGGD